MWSTIMQTQMGGTGVEDRRPGQNHQGAPHSLFYISPPTSPLMTSKRLFHYGGEPHRNVGKRAGRGREMEMEEWSIGEMVAVRATQDKWLEGQVRKLAMGGVRVWVIEAEMLVHVPFELVPTHMIKLTMADSVLELPTSPYSSIMHIPTAQPGRFLLFCVRPAHLAHRHLFHQPKSQHVAQCPSCGSTLQQQGQGREKSSWCAQCGFTINLDHQSSMVTSMSQQNCSNALCLPNLQQPTLTSPNINSHACQPSFPFSSPPLAFLDGSRTPSPHGKLESIPEGNSFPSSFGQEDANNIATDELQVALGTDCNTDCNTLSRITLEAPKGSMEVKTDSTSPQGHRFSRLEVSLPSHSPSSPSSCSSSPSPATCPSLAERMRKLKLTSSDKSHTSSSESSPDQEVHPEVAGSWVTVIQDGQNMRRSSSRQSLDKIGNA